MLVAREQCQNPPPPFSWRWSIWHVYWEEVHMAWVPVSQTYLRVFPHASPDMFFQPRSATFSAERDLYSTCSKLHGSRQIVRRTGYSRARPLLHRPHCQPLMSPHVHRPTARSSSTSFAYCGMQHTEGKDDFATTSATETIIITGQIREQDGLRPQIVVTCFYYFLLTVWRCFASFALWKANRDWTEPQDTSGLMASLLFLVKFTSFARRNGGSSEPQRPSKHSMDRTLILHILIDLYIENGWV